MAYDAGKEHHYGMALFHGAMAASDLSGAKALGSMAVKAGLKPLARTALGKGITKFFNHEAATGYRYVGKAEAKSIRETGVIPTVGADKKPKPVFFTHDKFTLGAEAKEGLSMTHKPVYRVEFNLSQAPAGYGGFTEANRVEFTLREGAAPIPVNKMVPLDDASALELDLGSRHIPPKLDR